MSYQIYYDRAFIRVKDLFKRNNMYAEADEMWNRVHKAKNNDETLMIIGEYVDIY